MDSQSNQLPSNKKFGYFFSGILSLASIYLFFNSFFLSFYITGIFTSILIITTLFFSKSLTPLNKMWLNFGLFIGKIISPLVLGLIFFLIITPMALIMKLIRRDELKLKINYSDSHWILRSAGEPKSESFKNQF